MKRDYSIVFWLNQPPKVEVGAYNYISNTIEGSTYYICSHDLPEERKALGWDKISYGSANLIILNNDTKIRLNEIYQYIKRENTIHIVCGLRGSIADEVCPIMKKERIKFYVVSERPSLAYNSIKNTIHSIGASILHRIKYYQYKNSVFAFLALGELGVSAFHKIGWSKEKLYRFMYCGEYSGNYPNVKNEPTDKIIKFLYIGRFKYKTHAVDVLQESFDKQKKCNWRLDLAGGYGEDKEAVIRWINKTNNARFLGRVKATDVQDLMSQYDVIIVTSRADGWNCQINEALYTNTPVITTIESVSGELVSKSRGGIVISHVSVLEFSNAIDYVLNNPNIIQQWSNMILKYKEAFAPKAVGEYLLSIIEYTYKTSPDNKRPVCPW